MSQNVRKDEQKNEAEKKTFYNFACNGDDMYSERKWKKELEQIYNKITRTHALACAHRNKSENNTAGTDPLNALSALLFYSLYYKQVCLIYCEPFARKYGAKIEIKWSIVKSDTL